MTIFRKPVLAAAACVLAGILAGILIQKFLPVGRTIQKIKAIAGLSEEGPNVGQAFVPVSPPPDSELLELARSTRIELKPEAVEESGKHLLADLNSRVADEERFRSSSSAVEILESIREARDREAVAEIEFSHDRIFRASNLESFDRSGNSETWREQAAGRIAEFSRLLAENGTHLIYSPAPNPLDCHLSHLAGEPEYRSALPEQTRFLTELLEEGVDVIDLRPEFGSAAMAGSHPFHRFDHHWTPSGIEIAADIVSRNVRERYELSRPFGKSDLSSRWIPIPASEWNLNLAPPKTDPGTLFGREILLRGAPIMNVPSSPIWVMGDSLLLEASQSRSGFSADFGSHLAERLGSPIYTVARPGTADIRPGFFMNTTLAGTRPKLLIWIHSDEEVHLPEIDPEAITAASRSLSGTARILEVSPLPDPKKTPYPDAIFSFRAELQLPRNQALNVVVYTWGFRNRKPEPAARHKEGEFVTLTLQPWQAAVTEHSALRSARVIDHLDNPSGDPVFWWKSEWIE